MSSSVQTVYRNEQGHVVMLDQTLLPHQEVYQTYDTAAGVADAITTMIVRGAPAIGVTAVARIDANRLAVGFGNGGVDLVYSATQVAVSGHSFDRSSSSPVTRIIRGPMGTVIVGFGDGVVGLFSWRGGKRLVHDRIHHEARFDQSIMIVDLKHGRVVAHEGHSG